MYSVLGAASLRCTYTNALHVKLAEDKTSEFNGNKTDLMLGETFEKKNTKKDNNIQLAGGSKQNQLPAK